MCIKETRIEANFITYKVMNGTMILKIGKPDMKVILPEFPFRKIKI